MTRLKTLQLLALGAAAISPPCPALPDAPSWVPRLAVRAQVLIFSQFKIMLDVLEDFMQLSGYPTERIDGDVPARERQAAIDRFSTSAPLIPDAPELESGG